MARRLTQYLAMAAAIGACQAGPTLKGRAFVCERAADCAPGFACDPIELLCVADGTGLGGGDATGGGAAGGFAGGDSGGSAGGDAGGAVGGGDVGGGAAGGDAGGGATGGGATGGGATGGGATGGGAAGGGTAGGGTAGGGTAGGGTAGGGTAGGGTAGGGTAGGGGGAPTYSVGGTVVGLAGAPLVLQLNGANDLPVGGNGAFTFGTALAPGAAYTVTVKPGGVPTGMGQACAVSSGGSGNIAGANVTSVRVRCSFTLTGDGGSIPDSTAAQCSVAAAGTPLHLFVSVDAGYFNVGTVRVRLVSAAHTFSGDLDAQLTHLSTNSAVWLFRRPGWPVDNCGADGRLMGTYRFNEQYGPTLHDAVIDAGVNSTAIVPSGDYCPAIDGGIRTSFANDPAVGFRNESVAGGWRLTLRDWVSSDTGSLGAWQITFEPP